MEGLDAGPLRLALLALECRAAWLKLGLSCAVICMPAVCTSHTGEGKQSALILRFALPEPYSAVRRPRGQTCVPGEIALLASAPVVRGPP